MSTQPAGGSSVVVAGREWEALTQRRLELAVLCGLQASGKSSFRRAFLGDHLVVSKDLMGNNRRKEQRQRELVRDALDTGTSVVVDNTNPTAEERRALVQLGKATSAFVVSYYFDSDFEACLERNNARPDSERVPYVGLVDVSRRLQKPTADEGFDERWEVSLTASGGFHVEPTL